MAIGDTMQAPDEVHDSQPMAEPPERLGVPPRQDGPPDAESIGGPSLDVSPLDLVITTRTLGSCQVIAVAGEIDLATAPQLSAALDAALSATVPRLVLDLSQVGFCDSSGLSVLVLAHRQLPPTGCLRVAGAAPQVARIFEITNLVKIFPLYGTVSEAMDA